MVQLPKNCKVIYGETGVFVKMIYATTLPVGEHNGINVFESPNSGKRYFELNFHVDYQKNLPTIIRNSYFEHKKKAMLFNRMKKQEQLQKEIDLISEYKNPGRWLF